MNRFFDFLPLLDFLSFVDFASLLHDAGFLAIDVYVYDVVFVEFSGPTIWDAVLHLVLKLVHVGLLGESLVHGLLMELIEFVVKFSDHLLDVLGLFLLVQLVDYGLLNVSLGIAGDY